jgi:hypothetical protein
MTAPAEKIAPAPNDAAEPVRSLVELRPILRVRLAEADAGTLVGLLLPKARRTYAGADSEMLADILMERAEGGYDAANGILVALMLSQARSHGRPVEIWPIRMAACAALLDGGDEEEERYGRRGRSLIETEGVDALVEVAAGLSRQGDARNATRVLVGVLEGIAAGRPDEGDDYAGQVAGLNARVSGSLAQAALVGGFAAGERIGLGLRIGVLRGLMEYGLAEGDALAAAHRALVVGWDDPEVVAVISGRAPAWSTLSTMEDESRLAPYRLALMKDRTEEAERIAHAARTPAIRAVELVGEGRVAEAMAHGRAAFTRCWEAHALWSALARKGLWHEAMAVGDFGLGLPGPEPDDVDHSEADLRFAEVVRHNCVTPDKAGVMLRAAAMAARLGGGHHDYEFYKEAAGTRWPSLRDDFVRDCLALPPSVDIVRILMDEGRLDDATAVFDKGVDMPDSDVKAMMQAVGPAQADWVVRTSLGLAEGIIARRRPNEYRAAAAWLGRATEALLAADRQPEARELVANMRARYGKRAKLGSLVDDIRTRVENRIARMEKSAARAAALAMRS